MSTDPQGAGWTDSLRLSRRTLLRFLPRRLTDAHRPTQAEVERDMAASEPPETVTSGELNTHSRQDLGRFLERLESNAALAGSAAGADSATSENPATTADSTSRADSAISANSATRTDAATGADSRKDDRGPE